MSLIFLIPTWIVDAEPEGGIKIAAACSLEQSGGNTLGCSTIRSPTLHRHIVERSGNPQVLIHSRVAVNICEAPTKKTLAVFSLVHYPLSLNRDRSF